MKRTIQKFFALLLVFTVLLSLAACAKDGGVVPFDTPEVTDIPDTTPAADPGVVETTVPEATDPQPTTPGPTIPQVTTPVATTPVVTTPVATTPVPTTSPAAPLVIARQPASLSVSALPSTVKFSVSVSGGTAPYQYKWYTEDKKQNATAVNNIFDSVSGADTATVTLKVESNNQSGNIWCVVTDANGNSVTSNKAQLKANAPFTFTKHPRGEKKTALDWVTFTVKVAGGTEPYLYRWYHDLTGTKTEIRDGKYAQGGHKQEVCFLILNEYRSGKVWCEVTDGKGKVHVSDSATLDITNPLYISWQPTDITAAEGSSATFLVEAAGGTAPYTYRWYCNRGNGEEAMKNGGGVSGTTTSKLVVSKLDAEDNGMQVWCVVTDAEGATDTSAVAVLTVKLQPTQPPATTPAPTDPPATTPAPTDPPATTPEPTEAP